MPEPTPEQIAAAAAAAAAGDPAAAAAAEAARIAAGGAPAAAAAAGGVADPAKAAADAAAAAAAAAQAGANKEIAAIFPDNWRQVLAGEDQKLLARLERMSDPKMLAQAVREQDLLIASGKLRAGLPENATPEQIVEFRKANNLPETPEGYEIKLPEGIVIGEIDKPIIAAVQRSAHAAYAPPEVLNQIVSSYYAEIEKENQAEIVRQRAIKDATTAHLKGLWGNQFETMRSLIVNMMEGAPVEVKDNLLYGETADGTLICNHAPILEWLGQMALRLNPLAVVFPGAGVAGIQNIEREIAELEKKMGDNYMAWQKDKASQERLLTLYRAREAFQNKGGGAGPEPEITQQQ